MVNVISRPTSQELMTQFLIDFCPIKRVRLITNRGILGKWTLSLVIDGNFINDKSIYHEMNKANISAMEIDLYNVLENVFSFKHEDILMAISRYLNTNN